MVIDASISSVSSVHCLMCLKLCPQVLAHLGLLRLPDESTLHHREGEEDVGVQGMMSDVQVEI